MHNQRITLWAMDRINDYIYNLYFELHRKLEHEIKKYMTIELITQIYGPDIWNEMNALAELNQEISLHDLPNENNYDQYASNGTS